MPDVRQTTVRTSRLHHARRAWTADLLAPREGVEVTTIVIPQKYWPGKLLNINAMRKQHYAVGAMVAPWRQLGAVMARKQRIETFTRPVEMWAKFRFPTNHKRDTGNLYPTIKAIVDGFVDEKVLVDDCDGVLFGPFLVREYPNGPAQITIEIEAKI